MRPFPVLLVLGLFLAAAGCVEMREPPRLQLGLEPSTVAQNGVLTLHVTFVNHADEPLVVDGPQGCLRPEAMVDVDGVMVPFDWPDGELMDCVGDDPKRVEPDGHMKWTLRLALGEHQRQGASLFTVGRTYNVTVDVVGSATSWDVSNRTSFQVSGEVDLPRVEVVPEEDPITVGEASQITATFHNTAPQEYTYTSSDSCNDVRVWVEDADGEDGPVYLWPESGMYACGAALTSFRILPGESVTATVVWDGSRSPEGGAPYAAPGTYTIKADLFGTDHAWPVEGWGVVTLRAPA